MHSTAQHGASRRCPVYLHPAVASNPESVRSIQQATGQLVTICCGKPQLQQANILPAFEDFGPWGGAA